MPEKKNELTRTEQGKLRYAEAKIAGGASDIYNYLRMIHDEKLYRGTHETFEAYSLEKWGMGRVYAHRLLQHGHVLRLTDAEMLPIGNTEVSETPENVKNFPAKDVLKESHTREVAGLPESEQVEILAEAIKQAPKDASGKPQVTAKLVREIRDARHPRDPFDVEEPEEPSPGEERSGGQEAPEDSSPRPPRKGKDKPGASKPDPKKEFDLQKSKTIKTCEALQRAFGDLNALMNVPEWNETAREKTDDLLRLARAWKYAER
jgi:hypothetical protein